MNMVEIVSNGFYIVFDKHKESILGTISYLHPTEEYVFFVKKDEENLLITENEMYVIFKKLEKLNKGD